MKDKFSNLSILLSIYILDYSYYINILHTHMLMCHKTHEKATALSFKLRQAVRSFVLHTLSLRGDHCQLPRRTQWHPHHSLQGYLSSSWSPQFSTDYSDYTQCCPWYQPLRWISRHPKGQHISDLCRWSDPRQR